MEKKELNLVEILKDAPKGTKLWSPICGECELEAVLNPDDDNYPIVVTPGSDGGGPCFASDGRWYIKWDGECMLFPSKDQRDWSKFEVKKEKKEVVTLHPGDKVLVREGEDYHWRLSFLSHVTDAKYYMYWTVGGKFKHCIPYNITTQDLIGTSDPCPIDYEIRFEK